MDNLIVTASPHITDNVSTRKLMGNVVISLIPCVIASTLIFGVKALLLTVVTTAACVAFEYIWCALAKKKNPVGDLSAVVTGIILAMNLPASLPIWMGIVGAFIAIVLVKQLFGGLGYNFANPALVGRIVLFSGFATRMTNYLGVTPRGVQDALSTATPLQVAGSTPLGSLDGEALTEAVDKISSLPLMDLFLGIHGGVMGETCALAILIGLVFLAFDGLFGAVHFLLSKARIAVTAQRIVGSTGYGTRIDLPVESLLAVEPIACHGLAVRTRSGHVRIRLLADHAAVQSAISGLLSRR